MGTLRVAICLIDEHDDCILSKRILNDNWTIIPMDETDLKISSNLFIDEISSVMAEKIERNIQEPIREMIEELVK